MARGRGSVFDQHLGSACDQDESLIGDNIKGPHIKDHLPDGAQSQGHCGKCLQARWGQMGERGDGAA